MPAPLAVDKEAVRVLVVAVGVREAARQMNIKEDTVLSWARRGGWLKQVAEAKERKAVALATKHPKTMQSVALKPADALVNTLLERKDKTQLGLSKWTATAAEHLGELHGEDAIAAAGAAKMTADVMAKVWPEEAGGASVLLGFFTINPVREEDRGPVVDV